jgi:hypothetical protein
MTATSKSAAVPLACEVRQTRDQVLVLRAFNAMSSEARDFLWERLQFESRYEAGELPDQHTRTGQQLLWHELLNAAHHTAGTFFVVHQWSSGEWEPLFVSADWTSARDFAQRRSAKMRQDAAFPGIPARTERVVRETMKKLPVVVSPPRD